MYRQPPYIHTQYFKLPGALKHRKRTGALKHRTGATRHRKPLSPIWPYKECCGASNCTFAYHMSELKRRQENYFVNSAARAPSELKRRQKTVPAYRPGAHSNWHTTGWHAKCDGEHAMTRALAITQALMLLYTCGGTEWSPHAQRCHPHQPGFALFKSLMSGFSSEAPSAPIL